MESKIQAALKSAMSDILLFECLTACCRQSKRDEARARHSYNMAKLEKAITEAAQAR